MLSHNRLATALALLATLGVAQDREASIAQSAQDDDLRSLGGTWLYVEDRTVDRPREKQGPPMSVKFVLRVEKDAVVHARPRGDERVALDGSVTEVAGENTITRYRGAWKDGVLWYETEVLRAQDKSRSLLIRREFRHTSDGLAVRVISGESDSVALYRHPEDIALPRPARATITDMEWLAGAWIQKRGTRSTDERWSPPLGGSMLGMSRTISRGKMSAFEYLRVVERDGGLVYVAQPGGGSATEFALTELGTQRAVFDNPRHDYPQRIVYELSAEGSLSAWIGFINGGTGTRFEFTRESK